MGFNPFPLIKSDILLKCCIISKPSGIMMDNIVDNAMELDLNDKRHSREAVCDSPKDQVDQS